MVLSSPEMERESLKLVLLFGVSRFARRENGLRVCTASRSVHDREQVVEFSISTSGLGSNPYDR